MPLRLLCTALLTGLSLLVIAQPGFVFSPATLPNGQYGAAYPRQTITVTGGMPPYVFSVSSDSLPIGMTLNKDGILSGIPHAAGTFTFIVTAKEKSGGGPGQQSGHQNYTLVIDPAPLTIMANNASMNYGGPLPTLSFSYSGFVNGDKASSLTTQATASATVTTSSPPGTYPITVSGAVDPNYSFKYVDGILTIHGATIHVTATAATKQFGTADPPLTYTATGLPIGVNLAGSLSRSPGENVGSYPINIGSLSAGNGFAISFLGNNFTITKAPQQITWSQPLSIGCNATTKVQLTATSSSGLPVAYTVSDNSIATVSGNILTLLQPGTTIVTAAQTGSPNFNAAAAVNDTLLYQSASLISLHWNDVLFFDNSSGDYVSWQWYRNDSIIAGATQPYYSATPLDGQYFALATDQDGQQIQTCTLTVTPGTAVAGGIRVFPNPVNRGSTAIVTCNYPANSLNGSVLQLTDLTGRVLKQIANVQPSMPVSMPTANGIYIIDLLLASGQKTSVNVLVHN